MPSVEKTDSQFDFGIPSHRDGFIRLGKTTRHKLTEEETNHLLSLTALSLSAFNVNNCRFVVVRDVELRKQINKLSLNKAKIPQVFSLIILCADLQHGEKDSGENGGSDSEKAKTTTASRKKRSKRDSKQLQRDEAMCSCGIAAQTLMLTAKAMGYDSWRVDGFDYDGVGEVINLPNDYVVAMLLVVGKNIKQLWSNGSQVNFTNVMIMDQFD